MRPSLNRAFDSCSPRNGVVDHERLAKSGAFNQDAASSLRLENFGNFMASCPQFGGIDSRWSAATQ
jgi:hypothetical protein